MKKIYEKRKSVTLYLDDDEYLKLVESAGQVPVSVVLRDLVRGYLQLPDGAEVKVSKGPVLTVEAVEPVRPSKPAREKTKDERRADGLEQARRDRAERVGQSMEGRAEPGEPQCKHGMKKGWRCWQCSGIAKIGEE